MTLRTKVTLLLVSLGVIALLSTQGKSPDSGQASPATSMYGSYDSLFGQTERKRSRKEEDKVYAKRPKSDSSREWARFIYYNYVKTGRVNMTRNAGCYPDYDLKQQMRLDNPYHDGYATHIDVRVWKFIAAVAHLGKTEVSCLKTGHSTNVAGSGNVSDHTVGQGADFSVLGGERVTSSMQYSHRSRVMSSAIRYCLRSGASQCISLLDIDGATGNRGSFVMSNHDDHLHVGF